MTWKKFEVIWGQTEQKNKVLQPLQSRLAVTLKTLAVDVPDNVVVNLIFLPTQLDGS